VICVRVSTMLLAAASVLRAQVVVPNPMDSIRKLPGYHDARDSTPLVSPARIAKLPIEKRRAWVEYVAKSRTVRAADSVAMSNELRSVDRTAMSRAPYAHGFAMTGAMTSAWFETDSAKRMAETIEAVRFDRTAARAGPELFLRKRRLGVDLDDR
jgi:hypothetical protein